jgi:hypothetical protein
MKLWHISQTVNNGYDTYDAAIVAAETEGEARNIHPSGDGWPTDGDYYTWTKPSDVTATYIGEAADGTQPGVILASFNAG